MRVLNQRGSLLPIAGIIVLILLVGVGTGAYFLGTRNYDSTLPQQNTPLPTITSALEDNYPVQPSSPTSIPISSPTQMPQIETLTQSYTNTEYGFEFKYPTNWQIRTAQSGGKYKLLVSTFDTSIKNNFAGNNNFSVSYSPDSLEKERSEREGNSLKYDSTQVGNRKAYITKELQGADTLYREVIVNMDSGTLLISAEGRKILDEFEAILTTFKFTSTLRNL